MNNLQPSQSFSGASLMQLETSQPIQPFDVSKMKQSCGLCGEEFYAVDYLKHLSVCNLDKHQLRLPNV